MPDQVTTPAPAKQAPPDPWFVRYAPLELLIDKLFPDPEQRDGTKEK